MAEFDGYRATQRDAIAAISKSTEIAFAAAQAVAEKQSALAFRSLDRMRDALDAAKPGVHVADVAIKEVAIMQSSAAEILAGMLEITGIVQQSQARIVDIGFSEIQSKRRPLRSGSDI
ncbi:MAG: hypothetical protein NVS2B8_20870 [Vulcanimicrobiaceae bacterium]